MTKNLINKRMKFPKNFKAQDGKYRTSFKEHEDDKASVETPPTPPTNNFKDIRQSLDEFFTPRWVAETMLDLAKKHGFEGGKVLEPSFGGGVFFDALKDDGIPSENMYGFEIYAPNVDAVREKHSGIHIYPYNFEFNFAKDKKALVRDGYDIQTDIDQVDFDLVIGNPPYGNHKSPYAYLFDKDLQVRQEGFFIHMGLEKLKKGGLLVFIINSLWLYNGNTYNKQKQKIAAIGDLIDAYRLPNNIFKGENRDTSIATDIVIFKKK